MSEEVGVGFTYVPVDPYRTWDTRFLGEGTPLPGGFVEFFTVLTDIQDVQRIPSDAVAVTYNLTVTETVGGGFAAIYPADIAWPGTSAINWTTSGTTVANAGTIAIGDFAGAVGAVEVFVEPAGSSTHYLIDITGYYVS